MKLIVILYPGGPDYYNPYLYSSIQGTSYNDTLVSSLRQSATALFALVSAIAINCTSSASILDPIEHTNNIDLIYARLEA